MLAIHSGVSGKVANFAPEQVANVIPESGANFDRNPWPIWSGIRTMCRSLSVYHIFSLTRGHSHAVILLPPVRTL